MRSPERSADNLEILKRIGIYGGTFDPIHYGHLILAREALERLALGKVIFVPAAVSPHKLDQPQTAASIRLAMLEAALEGDKDFIVDRCEIQRPPPSFTIDTVEEIRQRHPQAELFYFVGADNVPALRSWHRFGELEKLVQFVVLERTALETKHPFLTIRRYIDISATEIRNRVALGRPIRYLVPATAEEIIRREHLYEESKTLPKKT